MAEEHAIRVNFGKPMPLFPLEQPVLLPQQVLPLHIFEPRYRQMVNHALDGAGQIALAVFEGDTWKSEYDGAPVLRPAVCIGQIVQHQRLPDGRYNILLHGVCRAKISEEFLPEHTAGSYASQLAIDAGDQASDPEEIMQSLVNGPRLYRMAMLEPVGLEPANPELIEDLRGWVERELSEGALSRLTVADQVLENVRNEGIPADALMELVAFALLTDPVTRYRLLEEPETDDRLRIIQEGLTSLSQLIERAGRQRPDRWPKGISWN